MKNPFDIFKRKKNEPSKERKQKDSHEFSFSESTHEQLNVKDVNKILYYSFFISQGDIILQLCLLKYASMFYGKQADISVNEVRKAFTSKNVNFPSGLILEKNLAHPKVAPELLVEEIKEADEKTSMFDAFVSLLLGDDFEYRQYHTVNGKTVFGVVRPNDLGDKFNSSWMLDSIILWDIEFLINRGGRQNRKDKNSGDNSIKDKYMSVFVNFVLREEKTNIKAFDDMFKKLRSYYKNSHLHKLAHIKTLLKFYNFHHPESAVEI